MTTHQQFPGIKPADFARMQEAFERPELTCNFIACCYPDDLQDHHNRDNEILLSAYPDGSRDYIASELFDSYCNTDKLIEIDGQVIRDNEVKLAIDEMVGQLYNYQFNQDFDPDYDSPMIYAYLAW